LHRLESGSFLEDPITIHARKDILIRAVAEPDVIFERLKTDVVFTFVRHPIKRAYSCFNEKVHFTTKYSFPWVRSVVARRFGAVFDGDVTLERHRENFKSFLKYVRYCMGPKGTLKMRNPHWAPQSDILDRSVLAWRLPDFIGRVEDFNRHMQLVLKLAKVDVDLEVPRFNEGPPPPFKYEEILDDDILRLGEAIFSDDFQRFGYNVRT
jgi:hypothetical protein